MFAIIAGGKKNIGTGVKLVCLAIAQVSRLPHLEPPNQSPNQTLTPHLFPPQFSLNFGPNATTFIIPAEVFPTRVGAFGHGISAPSGKQGAILSALLFNYLSSAEQIGLANVLWIFFALRTRRREYVSDGSGDAVEGCGRSGL